MSPRLIAKPTWVAQLHCPLDVSRAHGEANRATSLGACLGNRRASPPARHQLQGGHAPPCTGKQGGNPEHRQGGATQRRSLLHPMRY
jgi:hypothetical protein